MSGAASSGGRTSEGDGSSVSPATTRKRTDLSHIGLGPRGSAAVGSGSEAASNSKRSVGCSLLRVVVPSARGSALGRSDVAGVESAVAALETNQRLSLRAKRANRISQRYPGSPRIEITATPKIGAATRTARVSRSGSQIGSRLRMNATAVAAPASPS